MRRVVTLAAAMLLALSGSAFQPLRAIGVDAAPANDNLANATEVISASFVDRPNMAAATLQAGESAACFSGTTWATVWYWLRVPIASDIKVNIAGIQDDVTAAVFGPFEALPTDVAATELRRAAACVYGVVPAPGLTHWAEPGLYLIRLESSSTYATAPTIYIEHDVFARYAGATRFATAAAVSAGTFAPGVEVAYVASAYNFPDALAGAAAAGTVQGPVLLAAAGLPLDASTAAELTRLQPKRIVVLGGPSVVGDAVLNALTQFVP
jgi:hypothetical protein